MSRGCLALVGGDEFKPGNEEQDRFLLRQRGPGPAYVLTTANGKHPGLAADFAIRWFASLGADLTELPVREAEDAHCPELVGRAGQAGLFYLAGGDPERVVTILKGTPVWQAMVGAWRNGAALAGSSAGAMAFGRWSLVAGPDGPRRPIGALDLLADAAVLPHYETFGHTWLAPAQERLGAGAWLLGLDERTALVHGPSGWQVMGPGRVSVIQGDQQAEFRSGARPVLNLRLVPPL